MDIFSLFHRCNNDNEHVSGSSRIDSSYMGHGYYESQTMAVRYDLTFPNLTVNSEMFMRVLFLRNFADAEFCENKTLAKWRKLFSL